MGYSRAGFDEIVGVDININDKGKPMHLERSYPFKFVEGDALEYLAEHGQEFDAIHASPPCQAYSIMHNLPWLKGREYPELILPTREMLEELGKPYVIENVMGARHGAPGIERRGLGAHGMQAGWLCGTMFGLPFYRHRLFETNWFWMQPGHPKHLTRSAGKVETVTATGTTDPGYGLTQWHETFSQRNMGIGHAKGWRLAAAAMGIDWMKREELTQAIPPAYTELIGKALAQQVQL